MISLRYASRTLKGLSYSSQWLGLGCYRQIDYVRVRLRTVCIAKRTYLFWSKPKASIKACTRNWVAIGDTFYSVTRLFKHANQYTGLSHHQSYQVLLHAGATVKITTAVYKILFVEMDRWRKAEQCALMLRKTHFLFCSFTGKSQPRLRLTIMTVQFIFEVVIDIQNLRKVK